MEALARKIAPLRNRKVGGERAGEGLQGRRGRRMGGSSTILGFEPRTFRGGFTHKFTSKFPPA